MVEQAHVHHAVAAIAADLGGTVGVAARNLASQNFDLQHDDFSVMPFKWHTLNRHGARRRSRTPQAPRSGRRSLTGEYGMPGLEEPRERK